MRLALLAHDRFPDRAKTAVGVLRYGDRDVACVLDRATAGDRVGDHVDRLPESRSEVPIVASMDEAPPCDALAIGIAPIGGGFDESWRPDVEAALERGCDVESGLHHFLGDDPDFAGLADVHGAAIHDIRRPPHGLDVADGTADAADARVVATVGTDCSVGKMTTTIELRDALERGGHDVGVVATGQTGVMIEGRGVCVDAVPADFVAGAVETMVLDRAVDADVVLVEGQGSLVHPAYSGVTLGILHGAMPDALVCCHRHDRERIHGYDRPLPSTEAIAGLYEDVVGAVSPTAVVAGAIDTRGLDETAARDAVEAHGAAIAAGTDAADARTEGDGDAVPATDPVRFGCDPILDAVLGTEED